MHPARLAAAVAAACLSLACSSPLDVRRELLGHWATAPEGVNPQGWYQSHLSFASSGSYQSEVRSYGVYPGQAAADLASYSREEGVFRAEGDHLVMQAQRLVEWDRFYGAESPERVYEPYPYDGAPFDGARFELRGDLLILRYTTYPADAPVETTREYSRVR